MNNINEIEQLFAKDLSSPLFLVLAAHYYDKRLYDYAEKVCNIGLNYHMHSIEAQYILAKILLIKGEVNQAEKMLKCIIKKQPLHLNSALLLLKIKKINGENKEEINNILKQTILFYSEHHILQKYQLAPKKKKKVIKTKLQKHTEQKTDFKINKKLATKTLYELLLSQKKYQDARNVLLIMKNNNKNKQFVNSELKNIKKYKT